MRSFPRSGAVIRRVLLILAVLAGVPYSFASAYNGHPRLVVVIVIDQFRGDYLERYRDQFGDNGFRFLMEHGAYFSNCNYDYANTRTAPGHATLFTGAYSSGHGIVSNEWWDQSRKKMVTSVEDENAKFVGISSDKAAASPHNLRADTIGDELKLATQGKSRVFGISLKDRAAILPGGFAADGAYWIDPKSGVWITSNYYRSELPHWVQDFNQNLTPKFRDREWKSADGTVLHPKNDSQSFYEAIGSTGIGNEYEFEFAKQLVLYENVGRGPATDLLAISLSPNDILGHAVGPDSPEMQQMALDLDRQIGQFIDFLGHQVGLAETWIAVSADHGIAPQPDDARKLKIPSSAIDRGKMEAAVNAAITAKFSPGHPASYVKLDYPLAWLDEEAFATAHVREREAEQFVGEAMKQAGLRDYFTKSQLAAGEAPNTPLGHKYLNSYAPTGSWYVMGVPDIFAVGPGRGTDHVSPYSYDTHVPLIMYGLPFQAGTYRASVEPVDLAPTLTSLLGINAPTHSVGRVLTEALAPRHSDNSRGEGKP